MSIEIGQLLKTYGQQKAVNGISFTVGNVPWKIFRVNSVYFAAFGRAGEALPTAQLAQLAIELDRKKSLL